MERAQAAAEIKKLIAAQFGAREETLTESTRLKDLKGWDSLGFMNFIGCVEERFRVKLTFNDVISIDTVGSVVDRVLAAI